MSINELQALLSLFPFLVYLQLTTQIPRSSRFIEGFSQWENFISKKLPLLEEFNFNINIYSSIYQHENIETILTSFCTPFWLEQKRWFVTAIHSKAIGIQWSLSTRHRIQEQRFPTILYVT
jgi:hypothetical protein